VLKDVVITASTAEERLVMDFPGRDKRSIFEPTRIVIETAAGELIEARDNPVAHFAGQTAETPWDDIDVAYFSGEALWTYLTTPFLFSYPGVSVREEPEPWREDGEQWRRLRVTLPDDIASHTREQLFHFGPDGLLRRHDYTVDILGDTAGANYALELREVDGIVVSTKRRIYGYQGDHQVVPIRSSLRSTSGRSRSALELTGSNHLTYYSSSGPGPALGDRIAEVCSRRGRRSPPCGGGR
jgi:hypothetical protein